MLDFAEEILTVALTAAVFAFLAWLFPARPPAEAGPLPPARRQAMKRVYGVANLAILVLAIPTTLVAFRALQAGARRWHATGGADHVLIAGWVFWALPALFLGLLLAGVAVELFVRWRLGPAYADLHALMAEQYGFDPTTGGIAVTAGIVLLVLGLSWTFLRLSFALGPEELRLDWPFHDPVTVPVSEIRAIREYRPGRHRFGEKVWRISDPHIRITYGPEEDAVWKSSEFHGPAGISDETRAAMEALSTRSGVPIEVPEPLQEDGG